MKKKIYRTLLLLLIVGLGASYFLYAESESVVVVRPVRGPAVQTVYATGTVEPSVMIPISAKMTAHLLDLNVDEGAQVTKGQILGHLEDTEQQKMLTEMQSAVDLAQKEYARRTALFDKRITSAQSVDQAKSALETAQARMDQVQSTLDDLVLKAPEDSIVIRRDGEIGELITAGKTVFWLASNKGLRITTEVDEEDIALVKPDQKVVIRADAFPDQIFNGRVQTITPKGDPVSRSYRVRIGLDAQTPLMIGMTAEANIITHQTDNALLVPVSAVRGNTIFTVQDGQIKATDVTVGTRGTKTIEVQKGIDENTVLVKNGNDPFKIDTPVRVQMETWKVD